MPVRPPSAVFWNIGCVHNAIARARNCPYDSCQALWNQAARQASARAAIQSARPLAAKRHASAGVLVCDIESLRLHYAETLNIRCERFMAGCDGVARLYDERFSTANGRRLEQPSIATAESAHPLRMERHRPRKLRAQARKRRLGTWPRAKFRPRSRLHGADQPQQPGLAAIRRPLPSRPPNHHQFPC